MTKIRVFILENKLTTAIIIGRIVLLSTIFHYEKRITTLEIGISNIDDVSDKQERNFSSLSSEVEDLSSAVEEIKDTIDDDY